MKKGLLIRGMCMGIADIIPGVSGGTMALVLGIYAQFIAAVRSVNLRPISALVRFIGSGFATERKVELRESCDQIHWRFLLPLLSGIAVAMAIGSMIIPRLMDEYPAEMRGLFFGLILASVGVPLKMMPKKTSGDLIVGAITALVFLVLGFIVTDPNRSVDMTADWKVIQADEDLGLSELSRRGPSSASAADIYWSERNAELRQVIATRDPDLAGRLAEAHSHETKGPRDKDAEKARSRPYDEILVPAGTSISVPRPSFGFIFLAGMIAICAMILPGISGSFILLILGCYYFVLNAVKGSLHALLHFRSPGESLLYVLLFAAGCLIGIASFSRFLSWMLRRMPTATMGALVGLMLGCLRGVWPWRALSDEGALVNILPDAAGLWPAAAIGVLGMAIALGIEFAGSRSESKASNDG